MEALLVQGLAGKARLEEAKRRLARYAELKDEQQAKRSRTGDVENSGPGAAASAASGTGAASKATAGHGTRAVAQRVERWTKRLRKAERRLARYAEITDEQQAKRSRTDNVGNSDPGAAASAASGAGAASKAAAGHGTLAVAPRVDV